MKKLKKILRLSAFVTTIYIIAGSFSVVCAQTLPEKQISAQYNWKVNQPQNNTWAKPIQKQDTGTKNSDKSASTTDSGNSGKTLLDSPAVKTGVGVAANTALNAAGAFVFPVAPDVGKAAVAKIADTTSKVISTASEIKPNTKALGTVGAVAAAGAVGAAANPLMPTTGLAQAMTAADSLVADKENQCAGAKPISNTDALHPDAAGLFDNSILADMQTMLHKLYKTFGLLFMVGHGLLCYATMGDGLLKLVSSFWMQLFTALPVALFIPNWNLLFSGIVIYFFAMILAMAVGLYFVDIAFKLGFAVLMLPVSIGLWPFKPTSKKLSENVSIIVRNAMLFTLMSIGLSFCIVLIMEGVFSGGVLDWGQFWEALETSNTGKMVENFSLFSMHTLVMAFCIIYGLKILAASIEDYLKYLFNDSVFGSESPVHHLSTQAVGMATNFAVKPVFKLAGDVAVHQTGEAIAAVGESIEKLGSYEGREGFRQNFKHVFSRGAQQQALNNLDSGTDDDTGGGTPPIIPTGGAGGAGGGAGGGTPPDSGNVNNETPTTPNRETTSNQGTPQSQPEASAEQPDTSGRGRTSSQEEPVREQHRETPSEASGGQGSSSNREPTRQSQQEQLDGQSASSQEEPVREQHRETPSEQSETPNEQRSSGTAQQNTGNTNKGGFREKLEEFDRLKSIRPMHILDHAAVGAFKAVENTALGGIEITRLTLKGTGRVIGGTLETTFNVVLHPQKTYEAVKAFAEVSETERRLTGQNRFKFYTLKTAKSLANPLLEDIMEHKDTSVILKSVRAIAATREKLAEAKENLSGANRKPAKYYLKKTGMVALRTAKGTGEDSAKVVGGLLKGFGRALADSTKEKGKKPKKTFLQQLCEKSAYQAYLEAQERKREEKEGKGEDTSYFSTLADQ